MIAKRIQRAGIRIVLLGVLFAQAAVAANACLTPGLMRAAPCAADAAPSHSEHSDEINLNLCLYQWAVQSDQGLTPPAFSAADTAVLTVTNTTRCFPPKLSPIAVGYTSHDPPIPIRFCSFQI
ncbi:MAG: hypothetical protein AAB325_06780 [Pseudomonadota bacterium]